MNQSPLLLCSPRMSVSHCFIDFHWAILSLRFDQLLPCIQSKGRFFITDAKEGWCDDNGDTGEDWQHVSPCLHTKPVGARQSDSLSLASHCLNGEAENVYNLKKKRFVSCCLFWYFKHDTRISPFGDLIKYPQSNSVSSSVLAGRNNFTYITFMQHNGNRSTSPCFEGIFVRLVLTTITKTSIYQHGIISFFTFLHKAIIFIVCSANTKSIFWTNSQTAAY